MNTTNAQFNIINKIAFLLTCIFIFLIPWGDSIYDGLPAIFGIFSFAFTGLSIIAYGSHRNYTIYHLMVVLLWVWSVLTLMWTLDFEAGTEVAKTAIQIMLLPFLFTLIIDSNKRILIAYQIFVFGSLLGSCLIISNYINGIQSPYYNRYGLANIETDILGIMLALSLPMAAYLNGAINNKWMKVFNIICVPIILYAIFLTGTRTATLVSVIGILYWLFSQRKASAKIKASVFIAFVLAIAALVTLAPKASLDRAFSSGKSISSGTLNYRTVIWDASIQSWKETPLVGTGLGGLRTALSKSHVNYAGAHSVYVEVLTETGVIGMLLYLLLLFSIVNLIFRTPFSEMIFLLSLFLIVTISQIAQHSHYQKETWFALTMIVLHASSIIRRNSS